MLATLLVLPPVILAQVAAVDLAEWGQEKAAPRPEEPAPGEITALDILITRRAWTGEAPPQVGQDIEGRLWLQGYLWMPR